MNIFRILADVSHTASKCILIWAIHRNQSAEGVSLLTQLLYILVFVNRYWDLFWTPPGWSVWNFILKIFYIASSAYIVFLMMRVYPRTREKEYGWKLAIWSLAGSAISAPFVTLIFKGWWRTTFFETLYTFSLELESVCVLPQLLLLRQTSVPTVLDSFYLVTLGSYRAFYLLNWLVRGFSRDPVNRAVDPIAIIFGLVQTALYVDFAWVYYGRQRVKLRAGGVVDSDDLSKSFLVRRIIGQDRGPADEDDDAWDAEAERRENWVGDDAATQRPAAPKSARSWGRRGISVSADDTLAEHDRAARDAQPMTDPAAFEDEEDDEAADAPSPPAKNSSDHTEMPASSHNADEHATDLGSSAEEWQQNAGDRS
ncbi:hypothetical protein BAUCODRAFT_144935 [Baudoinia panamericana UAMH 10762]|uniref:ER lumen protein-retaining receptor n=1 Tax=Baudoinia panamericana (strain UAMH 10762) TaxID=717646 RepID=M2N659_BAUPA|nr:uncharacterized protein BAUCODRAFT_144935 [Baudoinia panamericana UAMH 10762]EMC99523.1 hypothetical protein BAUCODRAFT_144935 [Baudoinia panamericana UAMH 10762]